MLFHLNLARAFAILLVTNSHLGAFYPWPFLASGGMVGNCLFFICSGWSIAFSLKKAEVPFFAWMRRRLTRLYFPLMLWMVALITVGRYTPSSWLDALTLLLWPVDYWFIPAIAIYYVPVYWMATRISSRPGCVVAIAFAATLYLTDYLLNRDLTRWSIEETISSKLTFYFFVISVGVVLGTFRLRGRVSLWFALASALIYLIVHYYLKSHKVFEWQLLVQISGLIAATIFVSSLSRIPINYFDAKTRRVVDYLASRSIYIYLAQVPFVTSQFHLISVFPYNFLAVVLVILVFAEILYRADLPRIRRIWQAQ